MTEDEAFLAAIRENPRDDTTRLVYADWLDERGDPRGEWLRIHVQLKQFVADGRLYYPLANRQQRLEWDAEIDPAWLMTVRRPSWTGTEIRNWREFYDALNIEPEGWEETVPKPTVEQLDRFEAETGFRLPQSYREYILVFGPGKLLTDWAIAAPGYGGSWFYDLQAMQEHLRYRGQQHQYWYFCLAYKDRYYWDPAEVTDHDRHECAVYRIPEGGPVVRVSDTFRGFVEDTVLHMLTYPNWDEQELGSPMRFELATRQAEPGAAVDGGA